MRIVKHKGIFAAVVAVGMSLAAGALAVSCTGYTDPDDLLRKDVALKADKTSVWIDGSDKIAFTILNKGTNVTSEAVITNVETGETLEGNVFTTTVPGTYNFTAKYNSLESSPLVVTAREASLVLSAQSYSVEGSERTYSFKATYGTVDVSKDEGLTITEEGSSTPLDKDGNGYYTITTGTQKLLTGTWDGHTSQAFETDPMRFYKRVGILEFTGDWCQYCSNMATFIAGVEDNYPDRNVMVAAHHDDAMAVPYSGELISRFRVNGLPAALLDFGDPITQDQTSADDMETKIRTMVEGNPAECGIAIETSVEGTTVTATVKLLSDVAREYGLAVALLEDGITGYPQTLPDHSKDNNYVHNHTLRTLHNDDIEGAPITAVAGAAIEKEFEFTLADGWNVDNCHIAVFATTGSGSSLGLENASQCRVGESVGFEYESDI